MTPEEKAKVSETNRAYREANRERLREQARAYYEANAEKVREKARARREANREKIREQQRARYKANPERQRKRNREMVEQVSDSYVSIRLKLPVSKIPRDLIEVTREQILTIRCIRQLLTTIKEKRDER